MHTAGFPDPIGDRGMGTLHSLPLERYALRIVPRDDESLVNATRFECLRP